MRAALCLALALSGCLVPERSIVCSESDRCEPPHVEAAFVMGKPDGNSNWYTHGLTAPAGVTVQGGMLFVADRDNNRIVVWKTWPSRSYQPPDLVIGQKQLSLLEGGSTSNSFVAPRCLTGDATRLLVGTDLPKSAVATPENNRLLQFTLPLAQNFPGIAQGVNIGLQPSMAGPRNFGLPSPLLIGDRLVVADRGFSRALMWSFAGNFAFTDPSLVFGQSNFTSGAAPPPSNSSLNSPSGCPGSDGTNLFLPDSANNRVLIFGPLASLTANNPTAKTVLGQIDFMNSQPNRGGQPMFSTLQNPLGVAAAIAGSSTRVAVVDSGNHRVLLWDTLPSMSGASASRALGQGNGTTAGANAGGVSLSSLSGPTAVYTDGTRIAVTDTENHRVLLWNSWPQASGQPADLVLGQPDGTHVANNSVFASATSYTFPQGMAKVGDGLALVDRVAHRVLLFPRLPLSADEPPQLVLGQSDLTTAAGYGGANNATADGMFLPSRVASDGKSLVVMDGFGFLTRLLIWSTLPTRSKQPADLLLGQPSFRDQFGAGTAQTDFGGNCDVAMFGGRIYVADGGYNRVLIWRSLPVRINQPADIVLGQPDLLSTRANQGAVAAANTLSKPIGIFADDGHLYVADSGNHRVLVWNTNDPTSNQPADRVIGQPSFSDAQGCTSGRLCTPASVSVLGNRLYITENSSHRVLSWPSLSPAVGEPPDRVFGQPDVSTSAPNLGRLAIDRLNSPQGLLPTERGLYIGDAGNGRVVVLPPIAP